MGFDDFTNFFNDSNTNKSSNNITQIQKKDTIINKSI